MTQSLNQRIANSRRLLGNPYAYLDDLGNFSATPPAEPVAEARLSEITASRLKLQNPYAHLNETGSFSAIQPQGKSPIMATAPGKTIKGRYSSLLNGRNNGRYRYADIEAKASELHRLIWQDRNEIWPDGLPDNPIDMLDPGLAFELVGFDFDIADGLGQYVIDGRHIEVAGVIDDSVMEARTSRRFPFEIQNFTAAHELGHALLHDARGLHRDRPLDGSSLATDPVETEANKFASFFLMPAKLVRQQFVTFFGTNCFVLNEDTRFALSRGGVDLAKCRSRRDISRVLAGATNYNGNRFQSLATQFRVSEETMAIRLEELELVAI